MHVQFTALGITTVFSENNNYNNIYFKKEKKKIGIQGAVQIKKKRKMYNAQKLAHSTW